MCSFKLTNNVVIVRLRQINGFNLKEVKDKIDRPKIHVNNNRSNEIGAG